MLRPFVPPLLSRVVVSARRCGDPPPAEAGGESDEGEVVGEGDGEEGADDNVCAIGLVDVATDAGFTIGVGSRAGFVRRTATPRANNVVSP